MPTATSTLTKTAYSAQIPLKAGVASSPALPTVPEPLSSTPTTTTTTLQTLYSRAARAFLLRDIHLTHLLLESAFALIKPPVYVPDCLAEQRRKWDILRITLELTVYSSPPPRDTLPESLSAHLAESSQTLITSLYDRSLTLFNPTNEHSRNKTLNAAYLPPQVLITLVYSSIKADCPYVGRNMIEDWLARRDILIATSMIDSDEEVDNEGYEKVVELYLLYILPNLEEWDYADAFLDHENELPFHIREHLKSNLEALRAQSIASRNLANKFLTPSQPTASSFLSRTHSPTPSSSSSSSSLSTTSTHTVVPSTPRGSRSARPPPGLTSLSQASASSVSLSSDTTATPRFRPTNIPNERSRSKARSSTTSNSRGSAMAIPRSPFQASAIQPTNPNIFALIKASLLPYFSSSKMTTFLLLFILFPLISLAFRIRRRRRVTGGIPTVTSNADTVRRRLQTAGGLNARLLSRVWSEVIRAIVDTIRMAGSGLV